MPQPTPDQLKELAKLSANMLTPEGYELLVKYCASNKITLPLSNGHWKHAAILLKEFFSTGKDHVFILSGKLFNDVFDDPETITKASTFIQNGGRVHVAFTEITDYETILNRPFVKASIDADKAAASGKKGTFVLKDASAIAPTASHIMVVDGRGFRIETDHKQSVATANFDYPEIAMRLEELFNSTFEKSIPVFPKAAENA